MGRARESRNEISVACNAIMSVQYAGAEPGLKHRGANLLIPIIKRGHTLLISNISNVIMKFYV